MNRSYQSDVSRREFLSRSSVALTGAACLLQPGQVFAAEPDKPGSSFVGQSQAQPHPDVTFPTDRLGPILVS